MKPIQNAPVNFFMGGGKYISDNFNMQILDTSNPNCFENVNLSSIKPDLMSDYINSDNVPAPPQAENSGGFFATLVNLFAPAKTQSTE